MLIAVGATASRRKGDMFYSQFGEDRILSRLFSGRTGGVCIEVGANNGVDGSTTLFFEQQGWDCVLIEPNPALCEALRRRRRAQVFECAVSSSEGVATLHVAEGADLAHAVSALGAEDHGRRILRQHGFATHPVDVRTRRLDDVLDEAGLGGPIDFISIDVEGHELEVLRGFSLDRWRPTVLIVEDNSAAWDGDVSRYLGERGYVRFNRTGVNDWYAHAMNARLAGAGRRLGYYPAMVGARGRMVLHRIADRLLRIPAARKLLNPLRRKRS